MRPAPYFDDVAAGPPGGEAVWAPAGDADVRVALWPSALARETVLIFPGRTEYVEKYSAVARDLHAAGFAAAAVDWRGQGLTERPRGNRMSGHVRDFADFQRDADAMVQATKVAGMPQAFHMVAHSMGGLIGLRSLMRGLPIARAAFSAPMWGLPLAPPRRLAAQVISAIGHRLGLGEAATPGSGKVADPANAPFEGNLLTTDRETFGWMRAQFQAHPELALGAPSLSWLRAAFREMREVAALPSPATATVTWLGTDERIVDAGAIRSRMARWPAGELIEVSGGRHEVLMETPALRGPVMDRLVAHLRGT